MSKNRTKPPFSSNLTFIQPASVARHVYGSMFFNKNRSKEMKEQLRALMLINRKPIVALN